MKDNLIDIFNRSLQTGFVDKAVESEIKYRPQLITNKLIPREKVLSTLIYEFDTCEEFFISVAFVSSGGITALFNTLLSLEKRNIKGRVLVSQYLNFTQPEALRKLSRFKNIELKISTSNNTHTKGYIFKRSNYYNIIVGSSNLTTGALTLNKEWNLKVSGLISSGIVDDLLMEFDSVFKNAILVTQKFITDYEIEYQNNKLYSKILDGPVREAYISEFIPNKMQIEALAKLSYLRNENKSKGLIISATGTGKTFLAAFDAKAFNPKKLLFVVHRLTIAKDALETFRLVFRDKKKYGIFSGEKRELEADFIFSTIQTISKPENYNLFEKNHFDYIIIDESHRSGANSYLKIIDYFKPSFLLGMTATPERTDGFDVFSLFDHNIAYEIRLNKAMEEDMLSEFHYFGITDLIINEDLFEDTKDFKLLNNNEKANKIIEYAKLYGSDNGLTRGLVFCSSNSESKYLSEQFNKSGFKTISLSGDSSDELRSEAIKLLESEDNSIKLDYIFTVDIFNEGIDIPRVNQILMIRPTESAIIFVQQLGRGLRKSVGKDYLTVIDFIGNHRNNYMIPIALYGDTSYNKDTIRKLISEGSKMLPGKSTINFDEISKERIYQSIDSAKLSILSDLKKDYQLLKYRLGRIPMMMDFLKNELRDPMIFVQYSRSYFNFVKKVDPEFKATLVKKQIELLELFANEINNGKRIEESYILRELIINGEASIVNFVESIENIYGYRPNKETIDSIANCINFNFNRKNENIIQLDGNTIKFQNEIVKLLHDTFFKEFLLDSVDFSISTFAKSYSRLLFNHGLIRYNKYSRKDVCRLLNWELDLSGVINGYLTRNETTPCFVTYHKVLDSEDSKNYNDHFINPSIFFWESRTPRQKKSPEIQKVIKSKRILLFIKKDDAEGNDFYYMGDVTIIDGSVIDTIKSSSGKPVVQFKFELNHSVPDNLYKYITEARINNKVITTEKAINEKPIINVDKNRFTIPLYDFYAAAGSFSEMQSNCEFTQIEVDEKYSKNDKYFACKVVGESMNRRIPNGSICIFKKPDVGSRNGKIVLVELRDVQDTDFHSCFTVKTYSSQKSLNEDSWEHTEIVLKPNSTLKDYKEIVLAEEQAKGMRIIGEFIEVLG
jgi:superfamily II DNA or RNA helicase/HKD family nuclease/SOS-response transcriptional repressor LexA